MIFGVPQFIEVEDKIAGPFTAKQLLWLFGMGAVLFILWSFLEKAAFFVAAVPVVVIFLALAFYRPYNQPLIKFVFAGFSFLLRPKIYSWQRIPEVKKIPQQSKSNQIKELKKEKKVTLTEIKELAKVIDSGGREKSEKAIEIIKEHTVTKNKKKKSSQSNSAEKTLKFFSKPHAEARVDAKPEVVQTSELPEKISRAEEALPPIKKESSGFSSNFPSEAVTQDENKTEGKITFFS